MKTVLRYDVQQWEMKEPFVISRGTRSAIETINVSLGDDSGFCGRGESSGVGYKGETAATMARQLEEVRSQVEAGVTCEALLGLLAPGGARYALDSALWDLEAKRSRQSPFTSLGITPAPVATAYTIGMRSLRDYEATAERYAHFPCLKIKVAGGNPLEAVRAVRRGAPSARFIVDPNQAWSVDEVHEWAPELADLGVDLLEQPIPVGHEAGLDPARCPIQLCADELVDGVEDLDQAVGRFQVVNIKLDKAGGLTAALRLADAASARGLELMVGCMAGSSLSIAPALVLAQRCSVVDLDAPLLLASDRPDGLTYRGALIEPPQPALWG